MVVDQVAWDQLMNALLAGFFVTSSLVALSIDSLSGGYRWRSSKLGLVLYGLGAVVWSIVGLESQSNVLIVISVLQASMVILGLVCFER